MRINASCFETDTAHPHSMKHKNKSECCAIQLAAHNPNNSFMSNCIVAFSVCGNISQDLNSSRSIAGSSCKITKSIFIVTDGWINGAVTVMHEVTAAPWVTY
jgi:hypothetical protein